MSMKYAVALAVVLVCVLGGGCATKGDKGKEKAAVVSAPAVSGTADAVMKNFAQKVQAKDLEGFMSLLTADFTHETFGNREEIHGILSKAVKDGYLEGVSVNINNTKETPVEDGTIVLGPIEVVGLFGHINFTLSCKEIEKQWYINRVVMDV